MGQDCVFNVSYQMASPKEVCNNLLEQCKIEQYN